MSDTRPQAQGTLWSDGTIKYADVIGSTIAPKNELIPNNCRYVYSDGRWSTRKHKTVCVWYTAESQDTSNRPLEYPTDWEVQSIIPVTCLTGDYDWSNTGTGVMMLVGSSEGVVAQDPPQTGRSCQLGMNMTGSVEMPSLYSPIVNWNFNKVALFPMIAGVYHGNYDGDKVDYANAVDLRDFYRNNTRPPRTTAYGEIAGYTYFAKVAVQDDTANVDNALKNFGILDEYYIKDTTYHIDNGEDSFDLRAQDCYCTNMYTYISLLGIQQINGRYAQHYTPMIQTTWTGPEFIEGIRVKDYFLLYVAQGVIRNCPLIPLETLDSELLNELDLTKIALQCGFPVISNSAVLSHFVYDKDDLGDLAEDYPDDVYYPKIADGRVSTEEYLKGEDVKDSPYYEAGKQGKGTLDPDVTPITDPELIDTNEYVSEIELNEPPITPIGKFSHYFMLSSSDIDDLCAFLFSSDTSTINRILDGLKMFGENPMRFLIGLMQFPLDLTQFVDDVTSQDIVIGNGVSTGVTAELFDGAKSILNFGSVKYRRFFGNFLDYAPYTQAKLYLPYCNEIELDTQIFAGHTVGVQYIIDWITGNCTAVISCESVPVYYIHGQMGVTVGISGEDKSDYVNQGLSAISRVTGGANSAISGVTQTAAGANSGNVGAIAGGISGIVSGGLGVAQGVFDFMNPHTPIETNGTSTSVINFYKPQKAYMILKQSVRYPVSGYENTIGNACEYSTQLSSVSGWTVCSNVKNITPTGATENEIAMIKSLLESGVFL